jgi:hypothetical protein
MESLIRALSNCRGLVEMVFVRMDSRDMTDEQGRNLAKILPGLTKLKKLTFSFNLFEDGTMVALLTAISSLRLKSLDLGSCLSVGTPGIEALAKSLHGNTSLIVLRLFIRKIDTEHMTLLAEAICNNNTLRILEYDTMELSPNGEVLLKAVERNRSSALKKVRIGYTRYVGYESTRSFVKRNHGLSLNAIGRRNLFQMKSDSRPFHPSLWADVLVKGDRFYSVNGINFFLKCGLNDILPFTLDKKRRRYPLSVRTKRPREFVQYEEDDD